MDLRFQRRIRQNQRGLSDLNNRTPPRQANQHILSPSPFPRPRTISLAGVNEQDFLSVLDFDPTELERCVNLAAQLKRERSATGQCAGRPPGARGVAVRQALVPDQVDVRNCCSRTRRSSGHPAAGCRAWNPGTSRGRRAKSRALGGCRSDSHNIARDTVEFALAAPRLHVINALTDEEHPCQALADFLTLREHWRGWQGRTLAFVGDGNNVATSLAHAAAMFATLSNRVTEGVRAAQPGRGRMPQALHTQAQRSDCSPTRPKPSTALMPSIPTSGPQWDRKRNLSNADRRSLLIRSTPGCSDTPKRAHSSCTVFLPSAARKSRPMFSSPRHRSCSIGRESTPHPEGVAPMLLGGALQR